MAGQRVYHWKHGWIPLTHKAASQKAHGSPHGTAKVMQRFGIADGPKSLHSVDRSNGGKGKPSAPAAPAQSADHEKAAAHAAKAAALRAAADRKRAEAQRISDSVGAPDRAGAMLRAKDSARMNARMDSGLRRSVEATKAAKALESKAHLAEARAKEAGRTRLTAAEVKGSTHVQDAYGWHEVVRVNAKTVTVKTPYSWTETIPIEKIRKTLKATPEQIAAAKAKKK